MPIEPQAPELANIIDLDAEIKELGSGYGGANGPAEGPLWWHEGNYLLFSDIHNNCRFKWPLGDQQGDVLQLGQAVRVEPSADSFLRGRVGTVVNLANPDFPTIRCGEDTEELPLATCTSSKVSACSLSLLTGPTA